MSHRAEVGLQTSRAEPLATNRATQAQLLGSCRKRDELNTLKLSTAQKSSVRFYRINLFMEAQKSSACLQTSRARILGSFRKRAELTELEDFKAKFGSFAPLGKYVVYLQVSQPLH